MITVIADDLTGASEIAGICLRYGIDIAFGIDIVPEKKATITIIATDSRSDNEVDAYKTHQNLTKKKYQQNSNHIIFKKCDSVLRGYILTELLALINVTGKEKILLQPSNPDGNRYIRNGIYYIGDTEIEKTGFASDPDFPAKSSSVENLLLKRSSKHAKIFTGFIKKIESKGIYIPDCNSKDELLECAELFDDSMLIAGSASFFEQFLLKTEMASSKKEANVWNFSKDYLFVSGSTHPESERYAKMLQKKHCPLILFPKDLLQTSLNDAILSRWIKDVSKIYKISKKLTLRISDTIIQFENSSKILKQRMSAIVKELVENLEINDLFIEGGATAYDILKKLKWDSFTPIAELASGVVRMQYDMDPKKYITIKPGSYQWPEGLLN